MMPRNFHVHKSANLPNYRALGRGLFIQTLIDLTTLCAWLLLGVLLVMAACAPLMFLLFLIFFN